MEAIAAVLFLAVLTEWLTERFFGGWLTGKAIIGVATVIGIALCLAFKADALTLVGLTSPWSEWANYVVTGLIVGGGSNAVHTFFAEILNRK